MIDQEFPVDELTPAELGRLKAVAKRSGYPPTKVLMAPVRILRTRNEGVLIGFQVIPTRIGKWIKGGNIVAEVCWAQAATGELPAAWLPALNLVKEATRAG